MCKVALRSDSHHYCLPCKAAYMKAWREKHPLSPQSLAKLGATSYTITYLNNGKPIVQTDKDLSPTKETP